MQPCPDIAPVAAAPVALDDDFGHILAHALAERAAGLGPLTERLGLSGTDLAALRDRWAPDLDLPDLHLPAPARTTETQAIHTLILWRAGVTTPEARWLAAILARRAQETRHLWEDLGLPSRPRLTQMIGRFLPGLAAANSRNMRWKKFFYRQICSDAAFSLCLSPSCDDCDERAACFAPD
jgi:nitrogen fixation protein NifQ